MNTTPSVLPIPPNGGVPVSVERPPVVQFLMRGAQKAETWLAAPVWSRKGGRKQSEAWLARSGERNARIRGFVESWKGSISISVPISMSVGGFILFSSYALEDTALYQTGMPLLILWATFMLVRWTATIIKGPFGTDISLPGVERLRDAAKGDVHRLADLEAILSALDIPERYGKPEVFIERVKSELGIDDARGLMLMLALPDEVDAPRGGEAEELLARVAELARTQTQHASKHTSLPGSLAL